MLKTLPPLLLIIIAFIFGILFWGGFNTVLDKTNNLTFCTSCHEMNDNVYQEYKQTIHFKNRTGVKAACPDCHVPKQWDKMLVRKIKASQEIFHSLLGSIDTTEKFEAKRLVLAKKVWASMQSNNSLECRNCHQVKSMAFSKQSLRSKNVHLIAHEREQTCIDCHKGIAHHLPKGFTAQKGGSDADHLYYAKKNLGCYLCHPDMPEPEDWGEGW